MIPIEEGVGKVRLGIQKDLRLNAGQSGAWQAASPEPRGEARRVVNEGRACRGGLNWVEESEAAESVGAIVLNLEVRELD